MAGDEKEWRMDRVQGRGPGRGPGWGLGGVLGGVLGTDGRRHLFGDNGGPGPATSRDVLTECQAGDPENRKTQTELDNAGPSR